MTGICSAVGPDGRQCALARDHPTSKPVEAITDHDFSGPIDEAVAEWIRVHGIQLSPNPEPPEVELARKHARSSEQCYGIGLWEQATTHASMATMYLAIAARKEAR